MHWIQFIIFFIGVFGLFIWNRAEGRADNRHMDSKLEGQRALLQAIWQESKDNHDHWSKVTQDFNSKFQDFNEKWLQETKEFHKRLCDIEAKK